MVGVIGLGEVGSSIVRSLQGHTEVSGWDIDPAARKGVRIATPEEMASAADLVVVALPARETAEMVCRVLQEGARAVCDTASVKSTIYEEVFERMPGAPFLPAHPLGGAQGIPGDLYAAPWALCHEDVDPSVLLRIASVLDLVEAPWIATTPEEHDRLLARTSHLVQMIHSALAAEICEWSPLALRLSGAALRDTTRLAGSPYQSWLDIITDNKENISGSLFAFQEELRQSQLLLDDSSGLRMLWRHAEMGRSKLKDTRWQKDLWRETSLPLPNFWQVLCERSRGGSVFRKPRLEGGLLLLEESR